MKIQQTSKYSMFRPKDENREVRPNPQLEKSMTKYGWLSPYPMHVCKNGRGFVIVDGQHRFSIAKKLNLPVKYVVDNTSGISVQEVNNAQLKWSPRDYLSSFVRQGLDPYLKLNSFVNRHKLPLSTCVHLLAGGRIKDSGASDKAPSQHFRDGTFQIKAFSFAERIAGLVSYSSNYLTFAKSRTFVVALSRCAEVSGFDDKRYMKKLKMHHGKMSQCASVEAYIYQIEGVYNTRANTVPIAVYATKCLKS